MKVRGLPPATQVVAAAIAGAALGWGAWGEGRAPVLTILLLLAVAAEAGCRPLSWRAATPSGYCAPRGSLPPAGSTTARLSRSARYWFTPWWPAPRGAWWLDKRDGRMQPDATVSRLAHECGVNANQVGRWLRGRRAVASAASAPQHSWRCAGVADACDAGLSGCRWRRRDRFAGPLAKWRNGQSARYPTRGSLWRWPRRPGGCDVSFFVARRNWLLADTVAGANVSANLYSLLQTCQVNTIDG